jgi:hypothetical protein
VAYGLQRLCKAGERQNMNGVLIAKRTSSEFLNVPFSKSKQKTIVSHVCVLIESRPRVILLLLLLLLRRHCCLVYSHSTHCSVKHTHNTANKCLSTRQLLPIAQIVRPKRSVAAVS